MLSEPGDIDWLATNHAYGPAGDLPDVLRDLRSPDEQRRTAATDRFRDLALHQGSIYPAAVAAVPYLIGLLADDQAPDRTLGHELLAEIIPVEDLDRLHGIRPHPLGPRLHELAEQRSHWYLARQEDWQRHGGSQPIEVDPVHRQAYEAVRAGIPAYLKLLDNPARDARALSAHLLSHFPEAAPQVAPALTARLAVEPDRVVAAFLCLATGMLGDQGDHELGAAVAARTDMPGKVERWTVLMGLVRLTFVPYEALLEQLCDCLFHGPLELYGWTFHRENMALGAYLALGELAAMSVPGLAAMLLERLAEGGDDESRFVYAVQLLLGLVFPEGPLPDGASPSDLSDQQRAAVSVVLRSGLLDSAYVARLLLECNLPGDEETLSRWCEG